MSHIHFSIPHKLTQKEAISRIKDATTKSKEQYKDTVTDVWEKWKDNVDTFTVSAKGYEITGTPTVLPSSLELDAEVPWALAVFRGKAEKMLRAHADKILTTGK